MILIDSHVHLQDSRLRERLPEIVAACGEAGVARMVVNGTSPDDWLEVLRLAREFPKLVAPSFGLHPWKVPTRPDDWEEQLERHLDAIPSAVGEIGLDRWIEPRDEAAQEEAFVRQLRLAARRRLPATIHCVRAWGWLREVLRRETLPAPGFLLHACGGPREMVPEFVEMGAYFSFSAYHGDPRKTKAREALRAIPADRLLLETDAPDMLPPEELRRVPLFDPQTSQPINHPANLPNAYQLAAEVRGEPLEVLVEQATANFARLFGGILAMEK